VGRVFRVERRGEPTLDAGDAVVLDMTEQLLAVAPHGQAADLLVGTAFDPPSLCQSQELGLCLLEPTRLMRLARSGRTASAQPLPKRPHATTLHVPVQRFSPPTRYKVGSHDSQRCAPALGVLELVSARWMRLYGVGQTGSARGLNNTDVRALVAMCGHRRSRIMHGPLHARHEVTDTYDRRSRLSHEDPSVPRGLNTCARTRQRSGVRLCVGGVGLAPIAMNGTAHCPNALTCQPPLAASPTKHLRSFLRPVFYWARGWALPLELERHGMLLV
jgi:hypothetical protein